MRLTAACPVTLMEDANNLAMVLAFGPADALTYQNPIWVDASGNLYCAASFEARDTWFVGAKKPLSHPVWDNDGGNSFAVNLVAANRAQRLMHIVQPDADGAMADPLAKPNRITIIIGDDGLESMRIMGLTLTETEIL